MLGTSVSSVRHRGAVMVMIAEIAHPRRGLSHVERAGAASTRVKPRLRGPSSMPSRQRWRAGRMSPTSSTRTLPACRCSTGWLRRGSGPTLVAGFQSSSSPRRFAPTLAALRKEACKIPSSRWGSESGSLGDWSSAAASEGSRRNRRNSGSRGGRECRYGMICR